MSNHHEKQKFLKALYESFYRAYNPKAADRLGIIYTPDEIVRFKIEAVDYLVFKHFGKTLGDAGVEILDPATGTGTYVTELIEYLPPAQLPLQIPHEIHCNEVAILPYYIANLNIEYTYKQRTGEYLPFENICFVDTLDNLGFRRSASAADGLSSAWWTRTSSAFSARTSASISVIIGNPPYNANQLNENENNKNREYPEIDRRIKETYIRHSTAQKTKVYDMYARFSALGQRPHRRKRRRRLRHQQLLPRLPHLRRFPQGRGGRVQPHLCRRSGRQRPRQPQAVGHDAQRLRDSDRRRHCLSGQEAGRSRPCRFSTPAVPEMESRSGTSSQFLRTTKFSEIAV